MWIRDVLYKLGLTERKATKISCDLAKNHFFVCLKLDIDYIKDLVFYGIVVLEFYICEYNVVYIFTRCFTKTKFVKLRSMLGMKEVYIK